MAQQTTRSAVQGNILQKKPRYYVQMILMHIIIIINIVTNLLYITLEVHFRGTATTSREDHTLKIYKLKPSGKILCEAGFQYVLNQRVFL